MKSLSCALKNLGRTIGNQGKTNIACRKKFLVHDFWILLTFTWYTDYTVEFCYEIVIYRKLTVWIGTLTVKIPVQQVVHYFLAIQI